MDNGHSEIEPAEAGRGELARNRAAVTALSVVARKLRFTSSRRSAFLSSVGLRPRLVDRLFKYAYAAAFALVLLVPNALTIGYFGFVASDQYQSETRFTVRSSAPAAQKDKLGDATGLPSVKLGQDTQIVANFVTSRSMLDALDADADFVKRYARPDVDRLARLDSSRSMEDRLDYWARMVGTQIDPQSGIVTVAVRAFSPQDANAILKAVVASSEKLINDLNDRVWDDATKAARAQVERATAQLKAARAHLQDARNASGIMTIDSSLAALTGLLTQVEGEKIALETKYQSNATGISDTAPQMMVLARQIASKAEQIKKLKAEIAGQSGQEGTLADTSSQFAQLNLEQQIAEQQLTSSLTALEQLQFAGQRQLMYLERFLEPTLPDSADYPRRALWIGVVLTGSLIALGAVLAMLSALRSRLD